MKKRALVTICLVCSVLGIHISKAQAPTFDHHILLAGNSSQARNIADFNNDGKGDIFVVEGEFEPYEFSWFEYPGWDRHAINDKSLKGFHYIADSSAGDVDQDGDTDIVIPDAHEGMMRLLWFENPLQGRGSISGDWEEHVIAEFGDVSWLKDVEVADYNRDGTLDVAVRGESELFMLYQYPGSWEKIHFPVRPHEGLASGDLDRDGFDDLILNGFWLRNPGKEIRSVWEEYPFDAKWFNQETGSWQDNNCQVRVGDINADGFLDIIISNSEKAGYPVSWYRAPADPASGKWKENTVDSLDYCHTLQIADFDRNGSLDILAAEMVKGDDPDKMVLYINNINVKEPPVRDDHPVSFTALLIQTSGAYWAVAGDLGGDGDIDIVSSRSYDKPPIEYWENRLSDHTGVPDQ